MSFDELVLWATVAVLLVVLAGVKCLMWWLRRRGRRRYLETETGEA